MKNSPVSCNIDFDADGIHHGHLKLPHSDDRSAWGAVMTPISVIKNGEGPTFIITGANHGDEYEGPVALLNLANEIQLEEVSGRIIMIPMMNYPAFCAGKRTSPIDDGNMNRAFPGKPDGTATEKVADYFNRVLLPMSDFVLDIHSGGRTLNFVPFAAAHVLQDKKQQALCEHAMRAFSAPYSVILLELDAESMYDTAAENQGKVFVSTELGGGGSTSCYTNEIARTGILNLCIHAGILKGEASSRESINVEMPDGNCFITSENTGLLELIFDLGDRVNKGQVIGKIYNTERTGVEPALYVAPISGILIGRHHPGLIRPGDSLGVIGIELS
jgi:N-alpha-acetyl-L-2,4-diaminobutyrate deacetylase